MEGQLMLEAKVPTEDRHLKSMMERDQLKFGIKEEMFI